MFKKLKKFEIIEFTDVLGYQKSSAPQPAKNYIPEWYKKTGHSVPPASKLLTLQERTVKKCVPVLDALTAGYIIPTPCDLYVYQEDGEAKYQTAMKDVVSFQSFAQAHLHPNGTGTAYPKWMNNWGIRTPKGWSILIVPPMHNPNPWFEALPGLVDTDNYNEPINLPFVLKNPKFEGMIPKGTPLVQIIPIKRTEWKMKFGDDAAREKAVEENKEINSMFYDRYKKFFWVRKKWNI